MHKQTMKKITRILICFFIVTQTVPMNLMASSRKAIREKKSTEKKGGIRFCAFFSILLSSMGLVFVNKPQASSTDLSFHFLV